MNRENIKEAINGLTLALELEVDSITGITIDYEKVVVSMFPRKSVGVSEMTYYLRDDMRLGE